MGWRVVGPLVHLETPSLGWVSCPLRKATITGLSGFGATRVPLPQFHPRSAPLRGRTRVTLCGMTFRSHLDPDPSHSPPGTYRVTVGQRGCAVLPEESRSHRCVVVPGGEQQQRGV